MNFPIGPEFIPDYRDKYPTTSLTVPVGTVQTLTGVVNYGAIHVEGTLNLVGPLTLTYVNILINGGTLWCGDDATPENNLVRLIKKDVSIDTSFDPFQWGHGIIAINGGQRIMCGKPKDGWGVMLEAVQGATSITLGWDAAGWEVGDELLLPDNGQMTPGTPPRKESTVTISSISGRVIGLSKGLDFDHLNAYDPDHTVFVQPCVANLTRKINIDSENPHGTRGHCVAVGMGATSMMPSVVDICHVAFHDMGRTRAENLDVTSADLSHIGTNQIAKYCDHDHHCGSSPMTSRLACVFINTVNLANGPKWALSTHQTSDSTIQDCVQVGFVGAGFVTEDGNEVRNVFEHNLSSYCPGNGIGAKVNLDAPNNAPGAEGAGFWFKGSQNHVRNNRGACCGQTGIQSFFLDFVGGLQIPSQVGGMPDTAFDPSVALPIEFDSNVASSNVLDGFESWQQPAGWKGTNLIASNNGGAQVMLGDGVAGQIEIDGVTLIAQGGVAYGLHTDAAYSDVVTVTNGIIAGCISGVRSARSLMSLTNVVLQNVTNVDEAVNRSNNRLFDHVTHKQLGSFPKQYVNLGWGTVWNVGDPFPPPNNTAGSYTTWPPSTGTRAIVLNWQGSGQNFLLYENNSLRNTAAWPSNRLVYGLANICPESGISMGECWDKYGLAYGGGVVAQSDVVQLEGILNGVAKLWDGSVQTGVPRCVMTYPTAEEALGTDLYFVLTGTPRIGGYRIQVDSQAPVENLPSFGDGDQPIFYDGLTPGPHTVQTWRLDGSGNIVPGSALVFTFGGATPPPPVWNPIVEDLGPPINGDSTLRVRAGILQKLQ